MLRNLQPYGEGFDEQTTPLDLVDKSKANERIELTTIMSSHLTIL